MRLVVKRDLQNISYLLRKGHLLMVPEVARKLHKDPSTIRRWIYEGRIDAIRVGGRWYVVRDAVDNLLEGEE